MILESNDVSPPETENILAVLEAYRSGYLKILPGCTSIWRGGKEMRGLGPALCWDEVADLFAEWNKSGVAVINWVEDVSDLVNFYFGEFY